MNVDQTTEALAGRLAARDPSALNELATLMGARIYRLAHLILIPGGSPEDVEEVVSDVLAAAWHRVDEFAPNRSTFANWVLMLTKYMALDRRRTLQRKGRTTGGEVRVVPLQAAPEPVDPTSPEVELLRSERRDAVRQALSHLDEPDRDLLVRRYWLEEPVAALAERLGLSRGALDTRLWRARQQLKNLMYRQEGTRSER